MGCPLAVPENRSQRGFVGQRVLTVFFGLFLSVVAQGGCEILANDGKPAPRPLSDPLGNTLLRAERCPNDILLLHQAFEAQKWTIVPAMVANRGRHNPAAGSFSFFERVTGKFGDVELGETSLFLGHFTGEAGGKLVFDRAPDRGKLLIEAIAFDAKRGLYHFYELIGTGTGGQWFFRGDSKDALADNRWLHRKPPQGTPKFGTTMRCSACHDSGGPILKELRSPHNDWWTKARPLPLKPNEPAEDVRLWMRKLDDTPLFAKAVRAGMGRLFGSEGYRKASRERSLPERLRPLFCTVEIQIDSDSVPADTQAAAVAIPSAMVVDPRLATGAITMSGERYERLLRASGLELPETNRRDADHRWLVPVKSDADLALVAMEVEQKLVDEEFVADVLAVDMNEPTFSPTRCSLLAAVPDQSTEGWQKEFEKRLAAMGGAAARELLSNRQETTRTKASHQRTAQTRLAKTTEAARTDEGAAQLFEALQAVRKAVKSSEISKNPKGQILEPGFRIIFPE